MVVPRLLRGPGTASGTRGSPDRLFQSSQGRRLFVGQRGGPCQGDRPAGTRAVAVARAGAAVAMPGTSLLRSAPRWAAPPSRRRPPPEPTTRDRRGRRPGPPLRPPHGLRVRPDRGRPLAHLRPHGDRELRPRRVPDARDVRDLLGLGPGGPRSRPRPSPRDRAPVRGGLDRLPGRDQPHPGRPDAGPDLRDVRAGRLPPERRPVPVDAGLPAGPEPLGPRPVLALGALRRRPPARRRPGRPPGLRAPLLVHHPHRDGAGPPGDGPGPPGRGPHGDRHRADVRARLGPRGRLRRGRRRAPRELLLRVPGRGRRLRAPRLRHGRARGLRQRRGDAPRREC